MKTAIAWFARNPVAANLAMVVIIVSGLVTLPTIRQELIPDLELDIIYMNEIMPALMKDMETYHDQFFLAEAWSNAMGAVGPRPPESPPEESDFPRPSRYGGFGGGGRAVRARSPVNRRRRALPSRGTP